MALALARVVALAICFGGAAFFVRDARYNLRDGQTYWIRNNFFDYRSRTISRVLDPFNFYSIIGMKFFCAATLLVFGSIYLWFGLTD